MTDYLEFLHAKPTMVGQTDTHFVIFYFYWLKKMCDVLVLFLRVHHGIKIFTATTLFMTKTNKQ